MDNDAGVVLTCLQRPTRMKSLENYRRNVGANDILDWFTSAVLRYIDDARLMDICPIRYLLCMRLVHLLNTELLGDVLSVVRTFIGNVDRAWYKGICTIRIRYGGSVEEADISILDLTPNLNPFMKFSSCDMKNIREFLSRKMPEGNTMYRKIQNEDVTIYRVHMDNIVIDFPHPDIISEDSIHRAISLSERDECIVCYERVEERRICMNCGVLLCRECFFRIRCECPVCRSLLITQYFTVTIR